MTSYSKAHANIAYQYKQEINKSDLDSRQHRNEFVTASGGFEDFNRMLANGFISNVNVVASNNTALQHILFYSKDKTKGVLDLTYLLTCHPPADINGSTPHRSWRPLHTAAYTNNPAAVKLFIDFNGDRDIVNGSNETAFDFAKKYNFQEVMKLLKDYLPSEEEKLASQQQYRIQLEAILESKSIARFNRDAIELKFASISAVKSGDLELLLQSLPFVNIQSTISLTIIAAERGHAHLFEGLCAQLLGSGCSCPEDSSNRPLSDSWRSFEGATVFDIIMEQRNNSSIEPLLYVNLDPTPHYRCDRDYLPRSSVIKCINRSRVISLFKMLYHKHIYLDIDTIFELVQTLLVEGLYDFESGI